MSSRSAPTVDTRLSLLETEVGRLTSSVHGIGVTLEAIRGELASRPRAASYRETIVAVSATVAVLAGLGAYAQWWLHTNTAVLRDHVAALEQTVQPGRAAVLEYRLAEIERRLTHGSVAR